MTLSLVVAACWCVIAALGGPTSAVFAAEESNTAPAANAAATPAAPANAATSKSKPVKKPSKHPKAKAASKTLVEPQDVVPVVETTKIEPTFLYRAGTLVPRKESVYHKEAHGDFVDQIYLTLRFARTYDYAHEIVVEPSFRTVRNRPAEWESPTVVEQAYIESAVTPKVSVTAGKKTEFEGSGYFVNPSDLLNEDKDLFDPIYQKEGVVFTRVRGRWDAYALGVGFIPARGLPTKRGKAWITASGEVAEAEIRLSATFQEAEKTTTGLSVARFFGETFEAHFDGRYQKRQRDPAVYDYLLYSSYIGDPGTQSDDSASGYYLGGSRVVLSPRRTIVLEYITQQSGLLPEEFERLFDARRAQKASTGKVLDPPTRLLGRHYGYAGYQDADSVARTQLLAYYLMNTDDQSSFATLSARYTLSNITSVELAPSFFSGTKNSEIGEMPFSQVVWLIFRGRF